MVLSIKKAVLIILFTLLICDFTFPLSPSFDGIKWFVENTLMSPNHNCDPTTHIHETVVAHNETYDKYIECCMNKETKQYESHEVTIYPQGPELNSSSYTMDNPDITPSHDYLHDYTLESRRQEIAENQIAQIKDHYDKNFSITGKVIQELSIPQDKILYLNDFPDCTLDSTIILNKTHTVQDLITALSSPIIKARFERIKRSIESRNIPKKGREHRSKKELDFLDLLLSGKITEVLKQIPNADLNIAQSAFDELKELWPWKREHTFLGLSPKDGTGEPHYINVTLGVNIMRIAEKSIITRPDYITKYATAEEQATIQAYREKCYLLQQKGNDSELFNQKQLLSKCVYHNRNKNDFMTNVCLAIAENCWLDPITSIFRSIIKERSLKKACDHVKNLEKRIVLQAEQQGIISMKEIRAWIVDHYGFDVLTVAQLSYRSRSDFVYIPENQSYLSDTITPILETIESKSFPKAHTELVSLEKQIDKALAEHNITDPIAQKECIKESFGRDVREVARTKYEARADHKELVASFISLDVNEEMATILKNNNTYESVAHEMSDLAKRIFVNGSLCKLEFLPQVESHVYDTIDAMRIAPDHPTFIFNLSMVNHTLGDIQQIAHAVLTGTHPVLTRSSDLLREGLSAFLTGLDPHTQAANMGHLAYDLGAFLKKSGSALWNDPIGVIHNGMNTTCTLIDLIRLTADFTSDLTVGRLYLSPQEYTQRTDTFCSMIKPLQNMTGEQYMQFIGQLGADILVTHGLGIAYKFLKEIDLLEKLGHSAATVARTFKKGFDTHLADNPIMVTAEGVAFQMSNNLKNVGGAAKEIINNSKALLESVYAPIALKLEDTITKIRSHYLLNPQRDFPNFGNKDIKIAFEHILGMELRWNDLGNFVKLSGFHHDFMGAIEKSKTFNFVNKVIKENGCYRATLIIDGIETKKTFFPQYWTPEDVVKKIYEAYYNHIKSGTPLKLEKNGKYIVHGCTSEGITIEMHITQKGLIKTAYPIVK